MNKDLRNNTEKSPSRGPGAILAAATLVVAGIWLFVALGALGRVAEAVERQSRLQEVRLRVEAAQGFLNAWQNHASRLFHDVTAPRVPLPSGIDSTPLGILARPGGLTAVAEVAPAARGPIEVAVDALRQPLATAGGFDAGEIGVTPAILTHFEAMLAWQQDIEERAGAAAELRNVERLAALYDEVTDATVRVPGGAALHEVGENHETLQRLLANIEEYLYYQRSALERIARDVEQGDLEAAAREIELSTTKAEDQPLMAHVELATAQIENALAWYEHASERRQAALTTYEEDVLPALGDARARLIQAEELLREALVKQTLPVAAIRDARRIVAAAAVAGGVVLAALVALLGGRRPRQA